MNDAQFRVGVDVGGSNLRVGVVQNRQIVWERRHSANFSQICRDHPPDIALEKIVEELSLGIRRAHLEYPEITSIGIGFPGFIDPANGQVSLSPNLPGLRDVDIAHPLSLQMVLPVKLENDALCAAWGEYLLIDPPPGNLLYLGLGTGVGGGLILNGKPWPGQHGVSMEAGHIIIHPGGRPCGCGNSGCLEQYASASGVVLSYRELAGKALDPEAIAGLAAKGDPHALDAYRIAAEALATGLAHILKVIDIETVVIGGGLSASWPLLQKHFDPSLDAELIPALRGRIRILPARAGDQAGMLGAALLAGP